MITLWNRYLIVAQVISSVMVLVTCLYDKYVMAYEFSNIGYRCGPKVINYDSTTT